MATMQTQIAIAPTALAPADVRHDVCGAQTCWVAPRPSTLCSVAPSELKPGGATLRVRYGTMVMQTQMAIPPTAPAAYPLVHLILAPAIIACALGLTAAWIFVLGYGFVTLIELAI